MLLSYFIIIIIIIIIITLTIVSMPLFCVYIIYIHIIYIYIRKYIISLHRTHAFSSPGHSRRSHTGTLGQLAVHFFAETNMSTSGCMEIRNISHIVSYWLIINGNHHKLSQRWKSGVVTPGCSFGSLRWDLILEPCWALRAHCWYIFVLIAWLGLRKELIARPSSMLCRWQFDLSQNLPIQFLRNQTHKWGELSNASSEWQLSCPGTRQNAAMQQDLWGPPAQHFGSVPQLYARPVQSRKYWNIHKYSRKCTTRQHLVKRNHPGTWSSACVASSFCTSLGRAFVNQTESEFTPVQL